MLLLHCIWIDQEQNQLKLVLANAANIPIRHHDHAIFLLEPYITLIYLHLQPSDLNIFASRCHTQIHQHTLLTLLYHYIHIVNVKSLGQVQLDAVDRALDASDHQEILVVESVEVQTQRGCLELHLAG